MKLEVGKFYKAANGTKVGPMKVWGGMTEIATGGKLYHTSPDEEHYWCEDGKNGEPGLNPDSSLNLISEWSDEVNFKVGDKVRRKAGVGGSGGVREGDDCTVTVIGDFEGRQTIGVDKGFCSGASHFSENFELVAPASPVTTQTITRNSVVPGVYGRLEVKAAGNGVLLGWVGRDGVSVGLTCASLAIEELEELHTNIGLIINAMRNPEVVE